MTGWEGGRALGEKSQVLPLFSPYPSHLALPFLVPISPCAVSLMYEDDWGRVRFFCITLTSVSISTDEGSSASCNVLNKISTSSQCQAIILQPCPIFEQNG